VAKKDLSHVRGGKLIKEDEEVLG